MPTMAPLFGTKPTTTSFSVPTARLTKLITPLDNPNGQMCAVNSRFQMIVRTPILCAMVLKLPSFKPDPVGLLPTLISSIPLMSQEKKRPSFSDRRSLVRGIQMFLPQKGAKDPWSCVPQMWRSLCSLLQTCGCDALGSILATHERRCKNGHVFSTCDAVSHTIALNVCAVAKSLEKGL